MIEQLWSSLHAQTGVTKRRTEEAIEMKQEELCRSRADALAAARTEFGREPFDRFLYGAIAVNMFHVSNRLPDAAQLMKIERGCR